VQTAKIRSSLIFSSLFTKRTTIEGIPAAGAIYEGKTIPMVSVSTRIFSIFMTEGMETSFPFTFSDISFAAEYEFPVPEK
jgi:hypothetical protein